MRFLQRIAGYPTGVQTLLQQPVTDALMTEYFVLLRGSAPGRVGSAIEAEGMVADALLARLIGSKQFLRHAEQIFRSLRSESVEGELSVVEAVDSMVARFADPEQPYQYKFLEAAAAEPETELGAVLRKLLQLLDVHRAIATCPATTLGELLACLATAPEQPGAVVALNGVLAALKLPAHFTTAEAAAPVEEAAGLAQHLLKKFDARHGLTADEDDVLRAIGRSQAHGFLRALAAPEPLVVMFEDGCPAAGRGPWEALAAAGRVAAALPLGQADAAGPAGRRLVLQDEIPATPLVAALCSTLAFDATASLGVVTKTRLVRGGWAAQIVGYPEDMSGARQAAQLHGAAHAPGDAPAAELVSLQLLMPSRSAAAAVEAVAVADAFALVVCGDAAADLAAYANIDKCVVFADLAALLAALAAPGAALMPKPVLFIDRWTPAEADYLLEAVQKFWSYGGRYLTSCFALAYDNGAGAIAVNLPQQDSLTLFAPRNACAVPLAALLADPAGAAARFGGDIVMPLGQPNVAYASRLPLAEATLLRMRRHVGTLALDPALHDAIFLLGSVDHKYVGGFDLAVHWPIESLAAPILRRFTTLRHNLLSFTGDPSIRGAGAVLRGMDVTAPDVLTLGREIDTFALRLSEKPEIVLGLPADQLMTYFTMARQACQADRIAANLAAYAQDICQKDVAYIVPFFELLACCLPRHRLLVVLAFVVSGRATNRKFLFRVAECLRRYGDEAVMLLFLGMLQRHDPAALGEKAILRCFQGLLGSELGPVLAAVTHGRLLSDIAGTVDFPTRFRQAVVNGDRGTVFKLVDGALEVSSVEFVKLMDGLRSLSNELRDLALDGLSIPGLRGFHHRKLAAVVLADRATLLELKAADYLSARSDVNAVAHNILGDNGMLNALLAERFAGGAARPFAIEGDSAEAVFANAARQLGAGSLARVEGPLVSVIVSAFNPDLALLKLSLQSMRDQTHAAIEVFLVDDASTADCSAAMQALLQSDFPEVKYRRLDTNRGPYVGRNLAIAEAAGDFIAIQDADDWSHPERFALQVAAFAAEPTAQLVSTPHIRIDRHGAVQLEMDFAIFGDGPMTSMFRRSAFDRVGVFAEIRSRGDVEMRERILGYFGNQAMQTLAAPAMLCFAASTTLSQKTKSENAEYLQIFRTQISRRRSLRNLRRDGLSIDPTHRTILPFPLRAFQEDEAHAAS
ncbi:glycosyltransferase family 2 protein [Roseomonas sp. 18066]|uniref:glycosyltransferase family 2 protein n=1 Tax=Roseomonas sp. 18066 TaxID=2681412 RepID=UPI00135C18CD|nr:glycosyltransferase family 2 protein [Roseomonas sp. 18066]